MGDNCSVYMQIKAAISQMAALLYLSMSSAILRLQISFFRAVKNGREKTPKPLRLRGFPVRYLFWSHNVVAETGLEPATSGL